LYYILCNGTCDTVGLELYTIIVGLFCPSASLQMLTALEVRGRCVEEIVGASLLGHGERVAGGLYIAVTGAVPHCFRHHEQRVVQKAVARQRVAAHIQSAMCETR
jgi:hypothetical protein